MPERNLERNIQYIEVRNQFLAAKLFRNLKDPKGHNAL
jgi:hypothetical protein